jgi:hypothetical protein
LIQDAFEAARRVSLSLLNKRWRRPDPRNLGNKKSVLNNQALAIAADGNEGTTAKPAAASWIRIHILVQAFLAVKVLLSTTRSTECPRAAQRR